MTKITAGFAIVIACTITAFFLGKSSTITTPNLKNTSPEIKNNFSSKYITDMNKEIVELKIEQAKINTAIGELTLDIKALLDKTNSSSDSVILSADKDTKSPEQTLDRYMDNILDTEEIDEFQTAAVMEQTLASLRNLPSVNVTNLQCAEGLCKAKFIAVDGKQPNIDELWGQPPLMHEGITIPQDDGSILLYFTDGETTLESLRAEANNQIES